MRIIQVFLLSVFLYIPTSSAEFTAESSFKSCLESQKSTTASMNNCTHASMKNWDKELNLVYNELMKKLPPKAKKALILSQREWIKHRDKEFDFISAMYNDMRFSGSMYSNVRANDRVTIVKNRVLKLSRYLAKFR